MAMFAETMEEAKEQVIELEWQTAEIGLKISYEKTKSNYKYPNKYVKVIENRNRKRIFKKMGNGLVGI